MHDKIAQGQSASQNIMATILMHLPSDSGVTKIEYEGPYIGLYTRTPKFLLENQPLVSQLVSSIKKRIVIRTDPSIRSSERSTRQILESIASSDVSLSEVFFDPALGEVTVFVDDFQSLIKLSQIDIELTQKTGWKMIFRRRPRSFKIYKNINDTLYQRSSERIQFYKRIGERIFRSKLGGTAEANIVCLGGFNEIGRSSILLLTHESKVILDFGLKDYEDGNLNSMPRIDISGVNIDEIDGVVISHAHLGHSGALPLLYKYGYDGPVYCTEPTLPLMTILQKWYLVSAKKSANYSMNDINEVIVHTIPVNQGSVTDISPDLRLMLTNSGHVLGSSSMHVHIGNGDHNLVYTSDFKFGKTVTLENCVWNFPRAETLIVESTHGSREDSFPPREDAEINLITSINSTLALGGKILIPVPALGLSQELCISLGMLSAIGKINPAGILVEDRILDILDFYEVYTEYLSKFLKQRIQNGEKNALFIDSLVPLTKMKDNWDNYIVLATPSDLSGGKSTSILKEICTDPINKIMLVSNVSPFSLAYVIGSGRREIQIGKKILEIKCTVDTINGFTNHSDYNQILAYISRLKPKLRKVITSHGYSNKCHVLATNVNKIFKIPTQHPSVQESIRLL
ncbi:MAG TPA: MBL fold metallo-hydrolase [Nitrososphaeraceae archaeon]